MLLAADLGNTNLTVGLFDGPKIIRRFRLQTVMSRTSDEYAALLGQMLGLGNQLSDPVSAAVLASVVPPLTDPISQAVRLAFGVNPLVIGPGTKTGIAVRYESPRDVGADRIVNAVAVLDKVPAGAIVVDFGTATTFDCVSPKGEYLGGVIAPGIQISVDALMGRAAKLRPVEMAAPPTVLGRNTAHSIQSGIVHGYAALVDGVVQKLKAELDFECAVIATGGLSSLIAEHAATIERVEQDLTLEGLRLIYERNRPGR
jgi:type III pantothenate kinase